jgi:hypothetical protein
VQQAFYGLFNLLKNTVPEGYALLRMLQAYLELDGLISLDVHTKTTLSMIEKELPRFNDALKVSIRLNGDFGFTNRYIGRNTWNWQ